MIKVFLVDDHEIVRRGLIALLVPEPDIMVIGEAGDAEQAMASIARAAPDVAVIDLMLPAKSGIELCRDLLSRFEKLRCLILTAYIDEQAILDAVFAGASGYVIKDIQGMELARAIREVAAGRSPLDNRATATLMNRVHCNVRPSGVPADLTEAERRLLTLIGEGLTNRQIAERLQLAEQTIKNYVSQLLAKLGVERRVEAALLASNTTGTRRAR
ncbi:DNA-binding response regulator [Nocardia yunnanensis]|uniref:DNA-binding response regulator n=1 Tax=Nocardia yunnanensis TaxID=2382165 RepID=A0A386ZNM0_9NOCA|nr:response regulator transcription factor [Nocardia yunnanensis]AYF79038.1 DNA-binding response regulator [Nocardia yunnanensis]